MIRMIAVGASMGLALLPSGPAYADFILGIARPMSTSAVPSTIAPSSPQGAQDALEPTVSRFKVARGFGNAVPLSFAARQIVPSSIRVRYGIGIDSEALVNWKGDRPWNQALAAAVHPLHLNIVTGTDSVLITR